MQNHAKKWLNHTSANAMAAIAIGAMLVFSLAGMKAFADVVHVNVVNVEANDVTVDVDDVVQIEFWITQAGGDGESQCNFGPTSGGGTATISLSFDSDVLDGPTSVVISDCGPGNSVTEDFTARVAGEATVTITGVSDNSPGSGTYKVEENSDVTVTVNEDTSTDTTPPVNIQFVGISEGEQFDFGEALPDVSCTAEDPESGVTSCEVSSLGTSVGSHTITATATNGVGLTATKELTYEILAWDFNGFYSPVDNPSVVNTIKGGQTVPIKFEVFTTLSQEEKTSVDDIQSFGQKKVSCSTFDGPGDAVEATTTGSTSLRYDESAGQFIANWKTPKEPNACYEIIITTDDGEAHEADFKLR